MQKKKWARSPFPQPSKYSKSRAEPPAYLHKSTHHGINRRDARPRACQSRLAQNLTSEHLTAEHLTAEHLTAERLTAGRLTAGRLTAEHLTSEHLTAGRLTAGRRPQNRRSVFHRRSALQNPVARHAQASRVGYPQVPRACRLARCVAHWRAVLIPIRHVHAVAPSISRHGRRPASSERRSAATDATGVPRSPDRLGRSAMHCAPAHPEPLR